MSSQKPDSKSGLLGRNWLLAAVVSAVNVWGDAVAAAVGRLERGPKPDALPDQH